MNIGVDIDDTITFTSEYIEEYMNEYSKHYLGDDSLREYITDVMRGRLTNELVRKFYLENSLKMASNFELKPKAKETLAKLREERNRIIIITARSETYYPNVQDFCEDYLRRKEVQFDKVITAAKDKVKACQDEKIDLLIDDSITTCENLTQNGINALVFNSRLNKQKETFCPRAEDWDEVYSFVHKMKK